MPEDTSSNRESNPCKLECTRRLVHAREDAKRTTKSLPIEYSSPSGKRILVEHQGPILLRRVDAPIGGKLAFRCSGVSGGVRASILGAVVEQVVLVVDILPVMKFGCGLDPLVPSYALMVGNRAQSESSSVAAILLA